MWSFENLNLPASRSLTKSTFVTRIIHTIYSAPKRFRWTFGAVYAESGEVMFNTSSSYTLSPTSHASKHPSPTECKTRSIPFVTLLLLLLVSQILQHKQVK